MHFVGPYFFLVGLHLVAGPNRSENVRWKRNTERMQSDAVTAVFGTVSQTESDAEIWTDAETATADHGLQIADYGIPLTAYVVAYALATNFEFSDR